MGVEKIISFSTVLLHIPDSIIVFTLLFKISLLDIGNSTSEPSENPNSIVLISLDTLNITGDSFSVTHWFSCCKFSAVSMVLEIKISA